MNEIEYESPCIVVIEVKMEQGYALSELPRLTPVDW